MSIETVIIFLIAAALGYYGARFLHLTGSATA